MRSRRSRRGSGRPQRCQAPTRALPSRNPTLAGFFSLGLFWGAWAAVLPSVQEATGASKGGLGLAMLFVSVGSIPSMFLLAAPAVDRFGARALARTLPGLIVTLTLTGIGSGLVDVAINANIGRIESETGNRLMPLAHGMYSVGVLVGAVGAGLARGAGVSHETILLAIAICIAITGLAVVRDSAPVHTEPTKGIRLARGLLIIGFVGAAAFVVEGGMESWSALFLERQLDAGPAVSGLGPGIFGAAMACGRFFGQAAGRFSDRLLLGGGSLLAAGGCTLVAFAPTAPVGLAGFALGGAGISLNAPIVFGVAGRRSDAGTAIATVTTIGYLGLLVGPPLVGGIAQLTGLRVSFVALAVIAAAVAATATRLRLE
jgi:MFS family permease